MPFDGTLRTSTDRGATWSTVPLPELRLLRVARVGGTLLAPADGDRLLRWSGDAWVAVPGAEVLRPRAITALGDGALVVGPRGVGRVGTDGRFALLRTTGLGGRALAGVASGGGVAFVWGGSFLARSTDGGRRWNRVRGLPVVRDLQVVDRRTVLALGGGRVLRSTDGGRRFRSGARALDLGDGRPGDGDRPSPAWRLEFSSARDGAVTSSLGAFRTTTAGRALELLPALQDRLPALAVPYGRCGVLLEDPRTGTVVRSRATGFRLPRLGARLAGRPRRDGKGVVVTVAGRLRGAPPEARVVLASDGRAPRGVGEARRTNLDGSFRLTAVVPPGTAAVRVIAAGRVTGRATYRTARSRRVRLP